MPIFLIKSFLSIAVAVSALVAVFTMYEALGRDGSRFSPERLKKLHRLNGLIYLLLFAVIAYFCLSHLAVTKSEPSPRGALHGVLSLAVLAVLALKVLTLRFYRRFYSHARVYGIVAALLTAGMVGTSGGYYLLVHGFAPAPAAEPGGKSALLIPAPALRTDRASISKGKGLYEEKCTPCHDPESNETIVGPGHKGILKNPRLPASGRPATPANIARQLRNPYSDMPSFGYLTDEEVEYLIAYLNTL